MPVQLQRKPDPLTAWQLTDEAVMFEVYRYAKALGWRGGVNDNGQGASYLELNADNPSRGFIAEVGDWVVMDIDLRKLTNAECEANYTLTETES
jgi:hypothetical protein